MAQRKLAPLLKQVTIRITESEMAEMERYCAEHGITHSEYMRTLLRIHLGFANDLKVLYKIRPGPTPKK